MKRRGWLGWGLLVAATGGLAGVWFIGSALMASTSKSVPAATAPARDIVIAAPDDIRLAATYWPGAAPDAPGVLLLHGNGGSRAATAENAAVLANSGYAALTIDFRGHGESTPAEHSFGLHESRDALAAFLWLKQQQKGAKVGVIGMSLGGAAALLGDGGPIPADALVLQAVYPDIRTAIWNRLAVRVGSLGASVVEPWLSFQSLPRMGEWPERLSPIDRVEAVRSPILFIGGEADVYTPPAEIRMMAGRAQGHADIWIMPNADHNASTASASSPYSDRVLAFFNAHLRSGQMPATIAR